MRSFDFGGNGEVLSCLIEGAILREVFQNDNCSGNTKIELQVGEVYGRDIIQEIIIKVGGDEVLKLGMGFGDMEEGMDLRSVFEVEGIGWLIRMLIVKKDNIEIFKSLGF